MTAQSLRLTKDAPNVNSYDAPVLEESVFQEENEEHFSDRSSVIQSGWDAAKKATEKVGRSYATDFKFDEDVQLIKFISGEPMAFQQHWVNRPGKKSFISIGEDDPLIAVGSIPSQKFAFTVLNLSDEEPQLQLMIVGIRLFRQLDKLASDKRTGPLNRADMYYAVSKAGSGTQTSYRIEPVKERDLADEWDIDPVVAADLVKQSKPFTKDDLYIPSKSELAEIAKEISSAN